MSSSQPPFIASLPANIPAPSALRLQALYASTSAQSLSNPSGYEANVRWWASVLHELLRAGYLNGDSGDRLVLKADDDLLAKLEGGAGLGRPKGIGGVLVRHERRARLMSGISANSDSTFFPCSTIRSDCSLLPHAPSPAAINHISIRRSATLVRRLTPEPFQRR